MSVLQYRYFLGTVMSNLQFNQVNLNALATVSDEGRHLSRVLSFADGHQKILGYLMGQEGAIFHLNINNQSSERLEIIQGECQIAIGDDGEPAYYREGQSVVLDLGAKLLITATCPVQYVRHLEG